MLAVLGLEPETIEAVCKQIDGYVVPVNYNSPVQTVIAGEKTALEKAAAAMKEAGAKRTVPLAVSAAFHSRLMQPAAEQFKEEIKDMVFRRPEVAFYSNLTGGVLTDFSDMPGYLAKHIVSPVRFVSELELLWSSGCTRFVELGPGKVLTGLVKKTLKDAQTGNIEDEKTLLALDA